MNLNLQVENKNVFLEMGCYGIGISRIVAAAIEQNNDDKGIIWPKQISPFSIALIEINPKKESKLNSMCNSLYLSLKENGFEVLWDDREQSPGTKFNDIELIGIPQIIILGEKLLQENKVELKERGVEKTLLVQFEEVLDYLQKYKNN